MSEEQMGDVLDKSHTAGYFRNLIGGLRGRELVVKRRDGTNALVEDLR